MVSSCFIFSFSGLARASMMQSEDRVKWNYIDSYTYTPLPATTHSHTNIHTHVLKDTGQDIVVEGCEVFQRVHHWNDEVVVPLDLRQHLVYNRRGEG